MSHPAPTTLYDIIGPPTPAQARRLLQLLALHYPLSDSEEPQPGGLDQPRDTSSRLPPADERCSCMTDRPIPPGYHRVKEAAAILGVGERFLRDGFNHGGFPGARMSGYLIFSDDDLAEIYRMHRVPARQVPRRRRGAGG